MDLTIRVDPPFSLALTAQVLRRLPSNSIDLWGAGTYARALRTRGGTSLVAVQQVMPTDLQAHCEGPATADEVQLSLERLLGLRVDVSGFGAAIAGEPRLEPVVAKLRGLRPPRFASVFETVGMVIPFQQVSLAAGMSFVNRLVDAFGDRAGDGERQVGLFPTPETVASARTDQLRACGLSSAKANSIQHIARLVADGKLTERALTTLPSPEALRLLDDLPGIGPWTAAVLLLRGLAHAETRGLAGT